MLIKLQDLSILIEKCPTKVNLKLTTTLGARIPGFSGHPEETNYPWETREDLFFVSTHPNLIPIIWLKLWQEKADKEGRGFLYLNEDFMEREMRSESVAASCCVLANSRLWHKPETAASKNCDVTSQMLVTRRVTLLIFILNIYNWVQFAPRVDSR